MATPESILAEVQSLTAELIEAGICVDQNFPSLVKTTNGEVIVGILNLGNLAITLKNIPYAEAYAVLNDQRSYNIKLLDGGLLQILYRFVSAELIKHRLAFFPSPDLLEYQNNSEIYEQDEL